MTILIINNLIFYITVPFLITWLIMPYMIRKLTASGYTVRDYYKKNNKKVPTKGGLVILIVTMFTVSLSAFFDELPESNFKILVVLALFGLFGVLDDMIDIGRPAKLILLYFCSLPLVYIPFNSSPYFSNIFSFLGDPNNSALYLYFIIPVYVLVTSNLVNMHSGFNGLASGTSLIVLITLLLKSLLIGSIDNIIVIVGLTGAILGYFWYNRYPSKIFWGNIGSLTSGAAIGIIIVLQGFLISGFIILIPHTINFLMYVYWRIKKLPLIKFGKRREDGTLEVPNPLTLKWVLPYYYQVTEKQATRAMYAVTAVFCVVGFFVNG